MFIYVTVFINITHYENQFQLYNYTKKSQKVFRFKEIRLVFYKLLFKVIKQTLVKKKREIVIQSQKH